MSNLTDLGYCFILYFWLWNEGCLISKLKTLKSASLRKQECLLCVPEAPGANFLELLKHKLCLSTKIACLFHTTLNIWGQTSRLVNNARDWPPAVVYLQLSPTFTSHTDAQWSSKISSPKPWMQFFVFKIWRVEMDNGNLGKTPWS